jgi:dTDP-4-amino-4,6-dideoxygalactose transaminase
MDSIQAAVLNVKLGYLDDWNKKRGELAQYYNNNLSGLKVVTPFVSNYSDHIYHQYVLRVPGQRDGLMNYLQEKDIDSRVFYPIPLHLQRCFKYLGYKRGSFPEAERAAKETLAIPADPDLTEEERRYIISSIKEFINGKN